MTRTTIESFPLSISGSKNRSNQPFVAPAIERNQHGLHPLPTLSGSLVIGTRNSRLALVQAELVRTQLKNVHPSQPTELHSMTTAGDENLAKPLYLLGGKSLWTKELEHALLDSTVDLIVHSLKDMPTCLPPGCELGAILPREDPRDALVIRTDLPFRTLDELPPGSVIGTSSVRRVAQLRRRFPQLAFQDIRGNLNTRFRKLDAPESPYTGIILAVAGLVRLGCADRISSYLEPPSLFHAVGQGAIGIEIRTPAPVRPDESAAATVLRERAEAVRRVVRSLEDWRTALRCAAERALLRRLEGGCSVPVGVRSVLVDLPMPCPWAPRARLTLTGVVTSVDGQQEVEREAWLDVSSPKDAERLGTLLADTLLNHGASQILEQLNAVKLESENESRIAAVESNSHIQIAAPANSTRTAIGANQDRSLTTSTSVVELCSDERVNFKHDNRLI